MKDTDKANTLRVKIWGAGEGETTFLPNISVFYRSINHAKPTQSHGLVRSVRPGVQKQNYAFTNLKKRN